MSLDQVHPVAGRILPQVDRPEDHFREVLRVHSPGVMTNLARVLEVGHYLLARS